MERGARSRDWASRQQETELVGRRRKSRRKSDRVAENKTAQVSRKGHAAEGRENSKRGDGQVTRAGERERVTEGVVEKY